MIFIITFDITVGSKGCAVLAGFAVCLDNRLNFLASICSVPLVEHIHYRQHIHSRSVFVGGINVIVQCNEADIVSWENVVDILPDLNVISSETAQVFNNNQIDFSRLCVLKQTCHGRSVEARAGIADTMNVNANYLIGRTNTTALKGKMKTVCEFTGLSDCAVEYLSELVKNKDYAKLSVINHLFDELSEDYDFYSYEAQNGEEAASSVLGALFVYFERCSDKASVWDEFADLGNDRRKEVLAAAYKQLLLNQVTELVKSSAEAYRRDNEPIER